MKLTYYGHSCFLLETKGKRLLFDPFIKGNELAANITPDDIHVDYILISHGHVDHMADAESIGLRCGAKVISNYEIYTWYTKKGLTGHPLNHGGKWEFEFGTLWYVNAVHTSSFPDGSYAGNPGGFVLHNEEGCIYFAGDTALTMDMKLIPMLCPPLDLAILPIGDNFTMDSKAAAIAAEFIACDRIVACHYDTFGWIKVDENEVKADFSAKGKELTLLPISESLEV